MKRVTGVGGIFFKCQDPEATKKWYREHLGLNTDEYGTRFEWRESDNKEKIASTQWSPFPANTNYFGPSKKEFMINYRVENLEALAEVLKKEGVEIVDKIEVYEYGKFLHIMDPDGQKIELWEPIEFDYDTSGKGVTK